MNKHAGEPKWGRGEQFASSPQGSDLPRLQTTAGVTLLELIIAISLVGLVSVGIVMSLRIALNAMDKTNVKLIANRKAMSTQQILEAQVAGVIPATSQCAGRRFLFFEGKAASMRFVSTYSLAESSRGYPRILEFRVIPGERGEGVRLIVNERVFGGPFMIGPMCLGLEPDPVTGDLLPQFGEVVTGASSFVLADRLAYCRFSYREPLKLPDLERWIPAWNTGSLFPTAIRIDMAPLEPDPSKLPVLSVTAPLRVNKWVLGPYADNN